MSPLGSRQPQQAAQVPSAGAGVLDNLHHLQNLTCRSLALQCCISALHLCQSKQPALSLCASCCWANIEAAPRLQETSQKLSQPPQHGTQNTCSCCWGRCLGRAYWSSSVWSSRTLQMKACIQSRKRPWAFVQLLLGKLPRAGVLEQHRLGQYEAVVAAVRSGRIGALNQALAANQRRFIMEVLVAWHVGFRVRIQGLRVGVLLQVGSPPGTAEMGVENLRIQCLGCLGCRPIAVRNAFNGAHFATLQYACAGHLPAAGAAKIPGVQAPFQAGAAAARGGQPRQGRAAAPGCAMLTKGFCA